MKKYWSRRIRDMVPYVPGEQPKDRVFIKLNTNENPYPPSPKALEALREAADDRLRLYPDPECAQLRAVIAAAHGLSPEQVFAGNGSDEVLAFCFQAFFDPDRPVCFADITYTFYAVYAEYFGLTPGSFPWGRTSPCRWSPSAPGTAAVWWWQTPTPPRAWRWLGRI